MSGCGGIRVADEHVTGAPSPQAAVLSLTVTASEPVAQPMSSQVTEDQATSRPTPEPTNAPAATPTQISGQPTQPITGTWRQVTTADGLCTDSPILLWPGLIGTNSRMYCTTHDSIARHNWMTSEITVGNRVAGVQIEQALRLVPDTGGPTELTGVRQTAPYVYRLETTVVFEQMPGVYTQYDIPALVGSQDARPTWVDTVVFNLASLGRNSPEIWIGTNGFGVLMIEFATGQVRRFTTTDGLPSNIVADVQATDANKPFDYGVWVATTKGVAHWDGQQWASWSSTDGLPADDVRGVSPSVIWTSDTQPPVKVVWVATSKGAAYFDGTNWHAYTTRDGMPFDELTGVLADANVSTSGRNYEVWFSTQDKGLIVFALKP